MLLTYAIQIILVFLFSCVECRPNTTNYVNIINKFKQDLKSFPNGYNFHRYTDSVRPDGYNSADVNHRKRKVAGQLEMEESAETNDHGNIGAYRLAGGYGYTISHDYGTQKTQTEAPLANVQHPGTSYGDLASIGVLQLNRKDSGGPGMNVRKRSKSIGRGKSKGPDSYIGKEIYGSSTGYDKLVKGGKNAPSVYPAGEYYESDVYGDKEKYDLDDGYGKSNKGSDKNSGILESEKHDGSQNYNENQDYSTLKKDHDYIDDVESGKYINIEDYNEFDDFIDKEKNQADEGYGGSENYWEPYEAPAAYVNFEEHNKEPRFENVGESFLDNFFKEYNDFSQSNIQAGFKNDHKYDDDFSGLYTNADEHGLYGDSGESSKGFFDDSSSNGDYWETGDGEKNSNFGEKKGHKKGSKTTGYHNVLNKDEYTKDHTFYEHADKNGHFNKDSDYAEYDYQNEGGHERTSHHDSGSNDDHHGKSDSENKGHFFGDDISDHIENGYETHYDDHSEYSDGGDNEYASKYADENYEHNR